MIPTIIGLGMALMLQCGLMDFTIGCRLIFAAVMGGVFTTFGGLAGFIAGCIVGSVLIALVTALLYRFLKIPSMVVSLGFILVGEVMNYRLAETIGSSAGVMYSDNIAALFTYPYNIIWIAVACVIFYFLVYHTKIGFHISAIGSDEVLASSIGVSPANVKTKAFLLSAVFVAIAAFLQVGVSSIVTIQLNMSTINVIFKPMMGVMIGMTLVSLWNNFPVMIVLGEICIAIIFNGMIAMGMSDSFQNIVLGLFLFAVLGISGNSAKIKEAMRKRKVRKQGIPAYTPANVKSEQSV
jgi:ribose transport system permease protein